MSIIFASGNSHKIIEINKVAAAYPIEIVGLKDIGFYEEIEETGSTLEQNALIKARHISNRYPSSVFSEDTGLEVDFLDGAPGVITARYAGPAKDHGANMDLLLQNLADSDNRRAQFRAVIALIVEDQEYLFEGIVRGKIALKKSGQKGFGYDPIFIPEGYDQCFAELGDDIKLQNSHRTRALLKMISFMQNRKMI